MDIWQPTDERYLRETLIREGERFGIPLSDKKVSLLGEQLRLVLEANRDLNLTAVRNPREAVVKHLVDSMTFYPDYHKYPGRYLDMGTGAGYPGMVLEILEPRDGVLLDSVGKKVEACKRIGDQLGLRGIRYVAERIETFAEEEPEAFGVITARALAPLGILLEYAQPLLMPHGVLVLSKGMVSDEEEKQGAKVAQLVGMDCVSREVIGLPEKVGMRTLLVYEKVGESEIPLPRRVGRAMKQPLWKRN